MKRFVSGYPILFVLLSGMALVLVQFIWIFTIPGINESTRSIGGKVSKSILAVLLLWLLGWRRIDFASHTNRRCAYGRGYATRSGGPAQRRRRNINRAGLCGCHW